MAAEEEDKPRELIEYPAWLMEFPRAQRRFCRLCARPVLAAALASRHGGVVYDFDPASHGRYRFGSQRMAMHVKQCLSAESYLPSVYVDAQLELTVKEAWLALWAAIVRSLPWT